MQSQPCGLGNTHTGVQPPSCRVLRPRPSPTELQGLVISEEGPIPARTCRQAPFTTVLPCTPHFFQNESGSLLKTWGDPSSLFKWSGTCSPQTPGTVGGDVPGVSKPPPWPGHSDLLNGGILACKPPSHVTGSCFYFFRETSFLCFLHRVGSGVSGWAENQPGEVGAHPEAWSKAFRSSAARGLPQVAGRGAS